MSSPQNMYDSTFLQQLFDEMQDTYERVSNITSLGFNLRWREQLVSKMNLQPTMVVADLMGGSGETWRFILPRIGKQAVLYNVDFSQAMCEYAHVRREQLGSGNINILQEDALDSSIPDASVDAIVCIYGVKTLAPSLYENLAVEAKRILKPDGTFGLVEISVPNFAMLRLPYMVYLHWIVPMVGALLLGNHENYRMLSRYMQNFQNCCALAETFEQAGFDITYHSFFFGCCTAVTGTQSRS